MIVGREREMEREKEKNRDMRQTIKFPWISIQLKRFRRIFYYHSTRTNLISQSRLVEVEESISAFIAAKMEKLKLKEVKLLAEVGRLSSPDREQLKDLKAKMRSLSRSLLDESERNGELDQVFLDKHRELSRVISNVTHWGERRLRFDTALGSIEMIEGNNSDRFGRSSESEDTPEMEMKKRSFKIKLVWNRCPHPMGVAECPWKDELVDDQLIFIAGADSKMVIGIERYIGMALG